jgi:hypothetical protein
MSGLHRRLQVFHAGLIANGGLGNNRQRLNGGDYKWFGNKGLGTKWLGTKRLGDFGGGKNCLDRQEAQEGNNFQ